MSTERGPRGLMMAKFRKKPVVAYVLPIGIRTIVDYRLADLINVQFSPWDSHAILRLAQAAYMQGFIDAWTPRSGNCGKKIEKGGDEG